MRKYSQFVWKQYKEGPDGQATIALFKRLTEPDVSGQEMLSVARQFDSRYFTNWSTDETACAIDFFDGLKRRCLGELDEEDMAYICSNEEERERFFQRYLALDVGLDANEPFKKLPQSKFRGEMFYCVVATWVMYSVMPQGFLPNLLAFQMNYLSAFAKKLDIELPPMPTRGAYKDRCMYYVRLNNLLWEYAELCGITQPEEVCAFWFDLALNVGKDEIENNKTPFPDTPENAWLLVGNYTDTEQTMDLGYWQANPLTRRGDIMIFYEKSPVKKVNAIWRAMEDGTTDPFFHYFSYTYIGRKMPIPDAQAIGYQEFKSSEYYSVKNRGTVGNYVSKNFQDCSGWTVSFEDYAEIKRMLQTKGFDTSQLPSLYEPEGVSNKDIATEEDVYTNLVTPMLEQMGWQMGKDFKREVEFAAGRSTTGHAMNKRPDYCLHLYHHGNKVYAKVIIEAKHEIRNVADLTAAFDQCLSYASWGKAKVMVVCDKNALHVYEQDRNGEFDMERNHTRYRWEQLKNHETWWEIKRKLDVK